VTTTVTLTGLSLEQFATQRRISVDRAAALIAPWLEAGILEERDGVLVVVDRLVVEAFAQMEALSA
jgi:hypothetical protein